MNKRIIAVLATLIAIFGSGMINGTANASAVALNTCSNSNVSARWGWNNIKSVTYQYVWTPSLNIVPWCAGDPTYNQRIVLQGNGDLTVWSGLHSGGYLIWNSGSGNQGANNIQFQGTDGNVVIYRDKTPLWASGIPEHNCFFSNYYYKMNLNHSGPYGYLNHYTFPTNCNGYYTKTIASWLQLS